MKEIIKFEIFYKALCMGVMSPLLSLFTGWFMRLFIHDSVVYNFDMIFKLLNIPGILFLLCCAAVILGTVYYEYIVVCKLINAYQSKETVSWWQMARSSLNELSALKTPWLPCIFIYYVLLNPLWHLSFVSSLIPRISIPSFIIQEILKMAWGSYITIGLYLVLWILYTLLSYVPVYMTLYQYSFPVSCKHSVHTMLHQKSVWLVLAGIFFVYYALETYGPNIILLGAGDFNFYFLRYFILSSSFRWRTVVFLLYSILWVAVEVQCILFQCRQAKLSIPIQNISTTPRKTILFKNFLFHHRIRLILGFSALSSVFVIFYFNQTPLLQLPYSIGHRGDISEVENSLEGILAADANGADFAEIDIQMTKDHVLVLCHDANLKRLTGKDLSIQECTYNQLQSLTLQDGYGNTSKIPTLEQAIQTAQNSPHQIGLLIEFKPSDQDREDTIDQTISLIEKYDFDQKAMFMSMDQPSVKQLAKKRPDWWIGYCAFGNLGRIHIRLDDPFIPDFIAMESSAINTQLLEDARDNQLPVYVWTIDDPDMAQEYLQMGVSGLIGDASDQVAYAVEAFKSQVPHDDFHYITTCPGFPQLTEDEYGYIQCER